MARLSYEKLEEIKNHFKVDSIWSWSRLSTYTDGEDDGWEYMIRYIRKEKVDTSNIYTKLGTASHDCIQGYINGELSREDMPSLFDDALLDVKLNGYTFPSDSIRDGYVDNLKHYFETIAYPIDTMDKEIEKPVIIRLKDREGNNIIFVGYIDLLTKDEDGKIVIVDFKSSSKGKFTGKQLVNSSRQLQLYAIGIAQMLKIDIENIRLRYDMQKYLKVSYLQKNGKWSKPTLQERRKWVETQENKIRTTLLELDYDVFDIDEMVGKAIENNSMKDLPQDVQDRFEITVGNIDLDMTKEMANDLVKWCVDNIEEINKRSQADDLDKEFPEPRDIDSFYFNVLAPNLKQFSKAWQEKQELENALTNDLSSSEIDDLFS